MTNASVNNVPPSDRALLTEPEKTPPYNTHDARVFLTQQAADATIAMQRTIADIQATAHEVADVRRWTQQYPWYAVGIAAVLGFMAATHVLVPSPPQT